MPISRNIAVFSLILVLYLGPVWLAPEAASQDISTPNQFELEYAGSAMWGEFHDIVRNGDYVYCAMTNGLQILDISDPTTPRLEKRIFLDEWVLSLALVNEWLYLGCQSGHLYVFDVSSPNEPIQLLDFDYSYGNMYNPSIWEIAPVGDTVYLACNYGLYILDLSDFSDPRVLGSFFSREAYPNARSLAVMGDTVFLGSSPLTVVDVSDPTNPVEISRFPVELGPFEIWGKIVDISLVGDRLYVADQYPSAPSVDSRFLVLDASNPDTLTEIGSFTIPGYLNDIALVDSLVYCATQYSGTVVLNVSDPAMPTPTACLFPRLGEAFCIDISGGLALVGNRGPSLYREDWQWNVCEGDSAAITYPTQDSAKAGDLAILDVSEPTSPEMIGLYAYHGQANTVTVHGDHAFVCSEVGGMAIVDISDPARMRAISRISTPDGIDAAAVVKDSLVIVVDRMAGLHIVDVSEITSPRVVGRFPSPQLFWFITGIAVQGDYVYLADYYEGLKVFDISDPTTPNLAASLATPGAPLEIAVSGSYAYVSILYGNLQVIDITDPTNPKIVSTGPDRVTYLSLDGNRLYTFNGSVEIFDISSAPDLVRLGELTEPFPTVYDLSASQEFVCMAHGGMGITVINVSDPSNPATVATYDSPASVLGVAVDENHVYVADGYSLIAMKLPTLTSIEESLDGDNLLPDRFQLYQNYPNPFNPSTVIEYDLPRSSITNLSVYNIMGQRVRTLVNEHQSVGFHTVTWDGRDSHNKTVASGVYFYRLTTGDTSHSKKMLLLK